jgi:hypothetical protein
MNVFVCMFVFGHVYVLGLQVPMVGKGVVEAVMATLAAVQGVGAPAIEVQEFACTILFNLSLAADNQVQLRVWGCGGCIVFCG